MLSQEQEKLITLILTPIDQQLTDILFENTGLRLRKKIFYTL